MPVDMKGFVPREEFLDLEEGQLAEDLSWIYTPTSASGDMPGTPKPVFLILEGEWGRRVSPEMMDLFELQVPANTPD